VKSRTSNELTGEITCRRSDVTIYVPTQCLLDETKIMVRVEKGDIRVRDVKNASIDTISLENQKGEIEAVGLVSYRINLNTTRGMVDALNVTGHIVFLLAQEEGGTIRGRNLTITDGDDKDSCRNNTYYMEGFPEEPIYLRNELVCDQEPGELTIDARGGEGDIVELDRIQGGNIYHYNKIGNTNVRLMACYDFVGKFGLAVKPVSKFKIEMIKSEEQLYEESRSLFGIDPDKYPPNYYWLPPEDGMLTAELCGPNSGLADMPEYFKRFAPNQTMHLKTNGTGSTGTIKIIIIPPALEAAMPSSLEQAEEFLSRMPPPPPMFLGK